MTYVLRQQPFLKIFFLLILLPLGAFTQDIPMERWQGPQSVSLDGKIIDSIYIDNRNIFEPQDNPFTDFLFSTANKLHVVTRESVIRRELLFESGDTFSSELAAETERNLRARLAINDAWIITTPADQENHIHVTVVTRDQWSLLFDVRVESDGNETDYRFGVEERNFLGYNQFLSLDYFVEERDGNFIEAGFSNPRFWGKPIRVALNYSNDPTDRFRSFTLGRPFYNLQQRFALSGRALTGGGRQDVFRDNLLVGQWEDDVDRFEIESAYRWGTYHRKLRLDLTYNYVFQTSNEERILAPSDSAFVVFPQDSVFHEFTGGFGFSYFEFIEENGIDLFRVTEDITLLRSLEFDLGRAFAPGLDGYRYNRLGISARYGRRWGAHIFRLAYDYDYWYKSAESLRRRSIFSATVYNTRLDFVTGVFRGQYISDWRDDQSVGLTLGGKSGLRGFDTNFMTGDRALLFNLEGRFFPGIELLSVLVGPVIFADVGRTYEPDQDITLAGLKTAVGAGLRFSLERFTRTELIRIDFAVAQDNTWQVIFGSGQYF